MADSELFLMVTAGPTEREAGSSCSRGPRGRRWRALMASDPAVAEGVMAAQRFPFRVAVTGQPRRRPNPSQGRWVPVPPLHTDDQAREEAGQ